MRGERIGINDCLDRRLGSINRDRNVNTQLRSHRKHDLASGTPVRREQSDKRVYGNQCRSDPTTVVVAVDPIPFSRKRPDPAAAQSLLPGVSVTWIKIRSLAAGFNGGPHLSFLFID